MEKKEHNITKQTLTVHLNISKMEYYYLHIII